MKVLMASVGHIDNDENEINKGFIKVINPTIDIVEELIKGEYYIMDKGDYVIQINIYTFEDNKPIPISTDGKLRVDGMSSETTIFKR